MPGSGTRSKLYPVIYIDALVVKVRDGAHVINKPASRPATSPSRGVPRAAEGGEDRGPVLSLNARPEESSGHNPTKCQLRC